MKISIIGAGRLGGALAIALSQKGYEIDALVVKDFEKAERLADCIASRPRLISPENLSRIESDVVFITTRDAEIEAVAENLKVNLSNKPFVFHTSGALSSDILKNLKEIGCAVGSLHPLISISDSMAGAQKFAGAYFCVEGDAEAARAGKRIVRELGGEPFAIEAKFKTLYHAAAVVACGHLVALLDAAFEMLLKCGLDEENARQTFLPLIKSTVANLENQTTAESLTGTFARADVATFEKHLAALRENVAPEILEIYLQLGWRSLPLAEKQGANRAALAAIGDELLLAKKNLK